MSERRLPVDGLGAYLHCPRQYEFAHVYGLAGDDEATVETRQVELLRTVICDVLRTGEREPRPLANAAIARLAERWHERDDRFHSAAQRRHERRALEATIRAYVETVGPAHARGVTQLRDAADGDVIGPALALSATVPLSDEAENAAVTVDATVDYVFEDGPSITGVRFVPTLAPLGPLRYRSKWDGDVAELFVDHFDPDADRFEPDAVATLLETAVVLEGLRDLRDRLGVEAATCRYVLVPLADRSNDAVDWIRETVETTLEVVDLTDVFLDHHTFGLTHEHRNRTVERRLREVLAAISSGEFDPSPAWDRISARSCPGCEYAVGCADHVAAEVRFDG